MIDNSNLNTYTNLASAKASLEQTKADSLQKADQFLGNFFETQKSGKGIDATGICAGLAVYGFRMIQQLGSNALLPTLPAGVPKEVIHLEMQLPRAILHKLPKGVDPQTVTRGREDLLINQITATFQRFIRKEGNVGIDAIFPSPDFQKCIHVKSSKKLRRFIAYLFRNSQENQKAHYLFCLHKPGQTVTEGHVFYAHLKEGIILDARFGAFLWKIEKAALPHFESLLVSYLKTNYEKWDLFACRVNQEPPTLYSKLPLVVRSVLTHSKIVINLARKVGLKKAVQATRGLPGIATIAHPFLKRRAQVKEFHRSIREVHEQLLPDQFKAYEKLALKYEQFSAVRWNRNTGLLISLDDPMTQNWSEVFKAFDSLDPRIHSLNSKLQDLFFSAIYSILEKALYRAPPEKKEKLLELSYSLAFELLERRKNQPEKFSLDLIVCRIAADEPKAEKFLEILLMYGADPDGEYNSSFLSPLYAACLFGHVNIVKLLLKYGANLSHPKYVPNRLSHALENAAKKKPEAAAEIEKLLQGPFPTHTLNNRHSYLLD